MNILLVGASGKLGSAVYLGLTQRGHTVLMTSHGSGDVRVDLTDPASIADAPAIDAAVPVTIGDRARKPVINVNDPSGGRLSGDIRCRRWTLPDRPAARRSESGC